MEQKWSFSNPLDRTLILADDFIGRKQYKSLDSGLGNQHPIKRIPMQFWKIANFQSMATFDKNFHVTFIKQVGPKQAGIDLKIFASQCLFHCGFPYADNTEVKLTLRVLMNIGNLLWEFAVTKGQPNEQMGIE